MQKKEDKRNRWLHRVRLGLCLALVFTLGMAVGGVLHIPLFSRAQELLNLTAKGDNAQKYQEVMQIMSEDWFFAADIPNVRQRLLDQALIGMTTNTEDAHTAYMTEEEIQTFTQSINRNFVGIGVQYRSTDDGLHIITAIMPDSPAEKAGVQVGDIIHAVDGKVVDALNAQEIRALVQGEEGTTVTIDFLRDGKTVTLKLKRAEVSSTVESGVVDDAVGYLHILQFGNTTAAEVRKALETFQAQGVHKLLIDLRDDGGGYLEALQGVVDCFLDKDRVFLIRAYSDGSSTKMKTTGAQIEGIGPIVLLVNGNTASAAEAFTLAMKEGREDVTIVGTTTYGKGTVQVTKYFDDGSAVKYTNSKWTSSQGVWINGTGITPDIEVQLADVLNMPYTVLKEDESYAYDSVGSPVAEMQQFLQFLGYEVDRSDGYFDSSTRDALALFAVDCKLETKDVLNKTAMDALIAEVIRRWSTDAALDTQKIKGIEVLHGQ